VATTACSASMYGGPPGGYGVETEDASASDGPSEAAPDAGDASATTVPTDSSSAAEVLISTPPYGQGPLVDE
jgi:hypothetical protein